MAKINLDLTRADYRRGRRRSPNSCLLARALERQYGGKWRVTGSGAVQRGVLWPRRWKLGQDASQVMDRFDARASRREILGGQPSRVVSLYGRPLSRERPPRRSRSARPGTRETAPARQPARTRARITGRKAVAGTAGLAAVALAGADGLAWLLAALVAVAGGILAVRWAVRPRTVRQVSSRDRVPGPARTPETARLPERVPERVRTHVPQAPEPVAGPPVQWWPEPAPVPVPEFTPAPEAVPEPWPEPGQPLEPGSVPEHEAASPEAAPEPWPQPGVQARVPG